MIITTGLFESAPKLLKAKDGVVRDVGDSKTKKTIKNMSKFNKLKNDKFENLMYIRSTGKRLFLTFDTQKVFNSLKYVFIKAPIFQHIKKCYI